MDTTSITLCMAFSDLQIKEASLMMMSDELNYVSQSQQNAMTATLTLEDIKLQHQSKKILTDREINVYQLLGHWVHGVR